MTKIKDRLTEAADHLQDSALRARYAKPPQSMVYVLGPEQALLLVKLFQHAAEDVAVCDAINDRDPDNDGKTRVMPHPTTGDILKLANHILHWKEKNTA